MKFKRNDNQEQIEEVSYRNDTLVPQAFYDFCGNLITCEPGETIKYKRLKAPKLPLSIPVIRQRHILEEDVRQV